MLTLDVVACVGGSVVLLTYAALMCYLRGLDDAKKKLIVGPFQHFLHLWTVLCFLSAAAWFEPFAAPTANAFKLGTEIALLLTLMLIVLLKIDLSKEDIPGGGDTVGAALLLVNVAPPAVSLVLSLLTHGRAGCARRGQDLEW